MVSMKMGNKYMINLSDLYPKPSHLDLCSLAAINKEKPVVEVDDL
jgi:hypothetical protein